MGAGKGGTPGRALDPEIRPKRGREESLLLLDGFCSFGISAKDKSNKQTKMPMVVTN